MDYRAENRAYVRAMLRYMARRRLQGLVEAVCGAALVVAAVIAMGSLPEHVLLLGFMTIAGLFLVGDGIGTFIRPEPTFYEPDVAPLEFDLIETADSPGSFPFRGWHAHLPPVSKTEEQDGDRKDY